MISNDRLEPAATRSPRNFPSPPILIFPPDPLATSFPPHRAIRLPLPRSSFTREPRATAR